MKLSDFRELIFLNLIFSATFAASIVVVFVICRFYILVLDNFSTNNSNQKQSFT